MKRPSRLPSVFSGFSLVEVTVAMGIFAFVAIGILGLLPAGMRLRAESAQETRAKIIAGELFASVKAAESLTNVIVRDGPALQKRNNQNVDLTQDQVLLGYPPQTTVPFGLWHSKRGSDPQGVWESGEIDAWATNNDVQTLALLWATNITADIFPDGTGATVYRVYCEVRTPATLPLSRSRPTSFSTLVAVP